MFGGQWDPSPAKEETVAHQNDLGYVFTMPLVKALNIIQEKEKPYTSLKTSFFLPDLLFKTNRKTQKIKILLKFWASSKFSTGFTFK